jgi:hypothetical protein
MLPATEKNLRSFGLLVGCAFTALGAWIFFKSGSEHRLVMAGIPGAVGILLIAFGLLAPLRLATVYKVWMTGAHWLGAVMTPAIMTLFYFTLLVPFTLIRFKDPLRLRLGSTSYWEPYRNAEPTIERFQRPF